MTRSRSRRIVLLLDCCYSGAFATGLMSRAGDRVEIKERFDGRGRVVLTASSAMEYSFEGDELAGEGRPSVFTSALVRGLATGEADRNRDGWISVDELYDYAYDEVRAVTPSQTPGKWVFDVQGDLYVARSGLEPEPQEVALPGDLLAATKSPFANIRAGAVEELAGLLAGPDESLAGVAREALEELRHDDSHRVAAAAEGVFGGSAAEPVLRAREPVQRPPEPRPAPRAEPPAPAHVPRLARAGSLGLLAALPIFVIASNSEEWNLFAVLSPLEALGAALAAWAVARALPANRVSTSFAAGILVAVGALTSVAACALFKFSIERIDALAVVLSGVVLLGSIAILAAGWPVCGLRRAWRMSHQSIRARSCWGLSE